jgi:hypothetical protein
MGFAAEGGAATAERNGDGESDPGFSRSDIGGEYGQGARGEPLLPKPFGGPVMHAGETEDIGAADCGGRIAL